jgi:translation initiation factor 2 alpha subunit (eIF-2alpha)
MSNFRLTGEQLEHCHDNEAQFSKQYFEKYKNGAEEHSGNMWEMGAYQALEQMEAEVLDQWSYVRQIRKVLDEIRISITGPFGVESTDEEKVERIKEILNRRKED